MLLCTGRFQNFHVYTSPAHVHVHVVIVPTHHTGITVFDTAPHQQDEITENFKAKKYLTTISDINVLS